MSDARRVVRQVVRRLAGAVDPRPPGRRGGTRKGISPSASGTVATPYPPSNAAAATPSLRKLGTGPTDAAAGDDARLLASDGKTLQTVAQVVSERFYGCIVQRTAELAVVNNTVTVVPFNGADLLDADAMHDPAGANPSRLTCPVAGVVEFGYLQAWSGGQADGQRRFRLLKNGALYSRMDRETISDASGSNKPYGRSIKLPVAANDYLELEAFQTNAALANLDLMGSVSEPGVCAWMEYRGAP